MSVGVGEILSGPSVDHQVAGGQDFIQRRGCLALNTWCGLCRLVPELHRREIRWGIGLSRQHLRDELIFGLSGKGPVEAALVSERAVRDGADALAAGRPRAMTG